MVGKVTEHLQAAYEIGCYLREIFPKREQYAADPSIGAYVVPSENFENGPDPEFNQTLQGMILEVSTNGCPEALYTRYGTWRITEGFVSQKFGDLQEYFARVRNELALQKIKERNDYSLWAVRKWGGREFVCPIMASGSEYHKSANVRAAFQQFKSSHLN